MAVAPLLTAVGRLKIGKEFAGAARCCMDDDVDDVTLSLAIFRLSSSTGPLISFLCLSRQHE